MDFVATMDFKSPYVVATGQPHRPTEIKTKSFKKGDIITGEIKTANGKPAFVLHRGVIVVPLTCVKQVITKDIQVAVDGLAEKESKVKVTMEKPISTLNKNKRYIDGVLIGAIVGAVGVFVAEKKGVITTPSNKNKIIGAVVGAAIGAYVIYRFGNKKK